MQSEVVSKPNSSLGCLKQLGFVKIVICAQPQCNMEISRERLRPIDIWSPQWQRHTHKSFQVCLVKHSNTSHRAETSCLLYHFVRHMIDKSFDMTCFWILPMWESRQSTDSPGHPDGEDGRFLGYVSARWRTRSLSEPGYRTNQNGSGVASKKPKRSFLYPQLSKPITRQPCAW